MADDLKLSVVIEAVLNAKGFEEAKAALKGIGDNAGGASTKFSGAGAAARGMGERLGGAHGPAADLARVLLLNVGAAHGVGESAKFAGVAVNALEGAAFGLGATMIGVSAGLSLLIPLLIKWINSSAESAKEQKDIRDALVEQLETFQGFVREVPLASKAAREFAAALQPVALAKQHEELEKLEEDLRKLEAASVKKFGGPGVFQTDEIIALKAQIKATAEAEGKGVTVSQEMAEARRKETAADKAATEALQKKKKAQEEYNALLEEGRLGLRETQAKERQIALDRDSARLAEREKTQRLGKLSPELVQKLAEIDLQQKADADLAAYEEKLAEEDAIRKQEATDQGIAAIGQALGAASDAFGKNKALAIAGAIADTYAGADKALAQGGWVGIAMAAAVIATGLANVKRIESSNPGFDDPFADLTARRLGGKSAADFVENFAGEFIPGVIRGMRSASQVTNHHTTVNRNFNLGPVNGVIGSRTEFRKWLKREMILADRQEGRSTVGR